MCLSKRPPNTPVLLFPVVSIFASAPLTSRLPSVMLSVLSTFCECHRAHTTTFANHLHLHPSSTPMRACLLPSLPLFCPSLAPTIPAPRLPASLQPSPLPLPRSSIVSAWFSSLSHSCSMQPCLAFTVQPEPKAAQPPIWGSGEGKGKHFKLQIQPAKQYSADSRAHLQAVRIGTFADIYRFASSQPKYTYPLCLCSRLSSHSHPLFHSK